MQGILCVIAVLSIFLVNTSAHQDQSALSKKIITFIGIFFFLLVHLMLLLLMFVLCLFFFFFLQLPAGLGVVMSNRKTKIALFQLGNLTNAVRGQCVFHPRAISK